jgi:hypothetical protein
MTSFARIATRPSAAPAGIHVLLLPQQWPIVLNLAEEHQHLLQLLGDRYAWFYR